MRERRGIFFAAFEPSGDQHAAPVIAEIRRRRPELPVTAVGGPAMARAGATLLENTVSVGVMGLPGPRVIYEHWRRRGRLRRYLAQHPPQAFVPVDSPAANGSLCRIVRQEHPAARIAHLVAPQLWAWRAWRIHKLRRRTDELLCLLPFEPEWFESRGIQATFVGHPLFSEPLPEPLGEAEDPDNASTTTLPSADGLRLALLPGSRRTEILRNWPLMVEAAQRLKQENPSLKLAAAAVDEPAATLMRDGLPSEDPSLVDCIEPGMTDRILQWADLAAIASGTATLQATRHLTPMVAMYNLPGHIRYVRPLVSWMFATRTFTLPNLVAEASWGSRAIPELVPLYGQVEPLAEALRGLLQDEQARSQQVAALHRVCAAFGGVNFAQRSADRILQRVD